ncbi:MAG TPA: DNA polymerase ligase N-terminal domain-containing protein [Candidatus Omnitrophota bacterium]|nr:DNA polymerase ligase N-terminal domain-containing protein [Candidatus Omnitrophota bacterium]
MPRFVVHEHHATKLHWDFRLEIGGVLKSWAVPRGPSLDPGEKRLAVEVADHDLEYGAYEGVIPAGQYGAGAVLIWDRGAFETEDPAGGREGLSKGNLKFRLKGEILRGEFALIKMRGPGKEKAWLLVKKRDSEAKDGWAAPVLLTPEKERNLKVISPNCSVND